MNRTLDDPSSSARCQRPSNSEDNVARKSLQWVQSICEQVSDAYVVFAGWRCVGMGGRLWREPGSTRLFEPAEDEWLSFFHEEDRGTVALGLADPAVNRFPAVRVLNRLSGEWERVHLRLLHPPFEATADLLVVVLQRAETAAQAPSAGHCDTFAHTTAETLVLDPRSGSILAANPAFLEANELDAEAVEGHALGAIGLVDPEVAEVVCTSLRLRGAMHRRPLIVTTPRGKERELLLDVSPVSGSNDRCVLTFTDVTVHNSATRHLSLVLNHLPVGVFTKDASDLRYLLSNSAADQLLAGGEALRGQGDEDLFTPPIARSFEREDRAALKTRRTVESVDVVMAKGMDEPRVAKFIRIPLFDTRGEVHRIVGVVQDVTHEVASREHLTRAKEAALRASAAKDAFLVNMGHELRTPLNAILGFGTLLGETQLDADQAELLATLRQSSEALSIALETMLELSQMGSGQLEMYPEETELEPFLEDLVDDALPRFQAKALSFRLEVDPTLPTRLLVDAARLRQMLEPLLDNACKFTLEGEVELAVNRGRSYDGRVEVLFSVTDSGIGIDPVDHRQIFEAFAQVDASSTRAFEGAGLGLTLARALAREMDGDIRLESALGQGAVFTARIELPLVDTHQLADEESMPDGIRLRLLATPGGLGESARRPLERWGLQVSVEEAFESFLEEVTDPAFEGLGLLQWSALAPSRQDRLCRAAQAQGRRLPLLIVEGDAEAADRARAKLPGIEVLEGLHRLSRLREAIRRRADEETEGAVASPATPAAGCALRGSRLLIVDDASEAARTLCAALRERGAVIDFASTERDAELFNELHRYDAVLFEAHFLGDETGRLLTALRRPHQNSPAPLLVAMALSRVSEAHATHLGEQGVVKILPKPVTVEALRALLQDPPVSA